MLDSRLNAVGAMGYFNQTAGNFTLVTSSPKLDLGANSGQVTATSGSLTFVADRIGLAAQPAANASVSATAGLITVAPFTAGRPIVLVNTAATGSDVLALSANTLRYFHADTLALGRAGTSSPVTLGGACEALDLSAFRAIELQTTGAVTQG